MADAAPPQRAPGHGDLRDHSNGAGDGYGGSDRDINSLLQARLGGGIGGLHRSGSAPPNFADELDSQAGTLSPLGSSWGAAPPAGTGGDWKAGQELQRPAGGLPLSGKDRDLDALADPAYVEYYYNQKNLNPRLPPPRTTGSSALGRESLWQGSEPTGGSGGTLFGNGDPQFQPKPRDSVQSDPWSSEPGKGLMGLPTLSTRPKSLFSEKPASSQQTWQDGELINSSSPVFGHPSSPFAPPPPRPIGTRDDGSLLLERNSRTSRAARSMGLGSFGSAPGTPTKSSMEAVTIESLLHEDLGRRLSGLSREGGSSLSTSPPIDRHQSINLGENIKNNSLPVTPTLGKPSTFENPLHPRNYQDLTNVQISERLANTQLDNNIRRPHSRSDSPLRRSPNQTPPQMSPPTDSVLSSQQSPEGLGLMQQSSARDLLPDSMYGSAGGDIGLGTQQDYTASMSAAIASAAATEMPQFPTSLSPGPMAPDGISLQQVAAQQQMQQQMQQAAATMSMMYPLYAQPAGMQASMQAAALAQAAALQMGSYPGVGVGIPPFANPALLMAQAGMYGQQPPGGLPMPQLPTPPGLPPEYAAYHQRMMEMYVSMAQGANPQIGNPSAAMAAAAAAMAAANDPAMANMAAAYAAAAAGIPPPHSGSQPGSGKTSPEPPGDPSHHTSEERPRSGRGKEGGRRGRRGEGRDSTGDDNGHSCPLLEQLKNNKTKKIELQDIVGNVMEFCTDQHGSRFIQLKLETSSGADTAAIFEELLPQAISLMTDVFGNYVVQKFFEHGLDEQRERLADTLDSNILSLSLQMYGCRVVQKALETLSLQRQRKIVAELNGQVMRCVRDQNGNHVIQKCIECVPTGEVAFMIDSFKGQVVMLSAHPYGCRVIQRVLEHCQDKDRVRSVMTEVLSSVCQLAQDQYGNYVVQHVLERGAAADRTEVISQLAGQIVEMSQHKFASNVVEKCLQHGSHSDRQILISEIMGRSEENGPLQMMMKDQFGNYVVQKLLEVCDDHQREALLTRIKQHLHNLKKYTYGKHIVARVEKLITNTQRLIRNSSSIPVGEDSQFKTSPIFPSSPTEDSAVPAPAQNAA